MDKPNTRKTIMFIAATVIIVVLLVVLMTQSGETAPVISYDELMEGIESGKVQGVYFADDYNVNILYRTGEAFDTDVTDETTLANFRKGKYKDASCVVTYRNALVLAVENSGDVEMPETWLNNPGNGNVTSYIFSGLSLVLLVGIALYFIISMRKNNGGGTAMNFGKTKAKVANKVNVKFEDVAGAEEEKDELKEIVEFLKSPKKFREVGARVPRGVLLVGSPGTGKTLFAKAVAGEANVPFYSISGSDFVEMFVGVGASRVRDLFAQAKRTQPCIVFIDEIDAVGRKRGAGLGGGNDEREQTLNQLLVQMDGFDANDGIVIMAATNRADVLDPALLRPGRFDRQIYVHMPDVKGREAIFRVHSRNKPLSSDVDFKNLARLTTGFSGADIENLLNEAAILAARDGRKLILMEDVLEGINKVLAGPQKKSRVITERDKRITAYHEAGHALVGRFMKYCDAVQEVSIIPRGMAAGYTISRPKTDDNHISKNHLNDTIAMMLGGRAAEQLVIQDITTGASMDLKQSTSIARSMVVEFGMSAELPNIYFGGEQEVFIGRDYQTQASYGNEVAAVIDKEIRAIIDENYQRALSCIEEHLDTLHAMVKLLFENETIYGDEVDLLISGKTVEEVSAYINEKKEKQQELARQKAEELKRAEEARREAPKPVPAIPLTPEHEIHLTSEPETEESAEPEAEEPAEPETSDQ